MPYSKSDRLGRIADFGQMAQQRNFPGAQMIIFIACRQSVLIDAIIPPWTVLALTRVMGVCRALP